MDPRRILRHRFVVVPVALALAVAAWNLWIAFHDDGLIAGEVRDSAGLPVPGATVILFERNFVTHVERTRTRTDAAGRYRFDDNATHLAQLEAETGDGRRSDRHTLRLWFKAQNAVAPPLVVK